MICSPKIASSWDVLTMLRKTYSYCGVFINGEQIRQFSIPLLIINANVRCSLITDIYNGHCFRDMTLCGRNELRHHALLTQMNTLLDSRGIACITQVAMLAECAVHRSQ